MTKHEEILSYSPTEFESPVTVQTFFNIIRIYSLMGDVDHGIWLRLSDGEWYKLNKDDKDFDKIADNLLTELKCKQSTTITL